MQGHANLSRAELPTQATFGELVGASLKMQELYELIRKISQQSCPVLIMGESGTGKELVARCIHDLGPRRKSPLTPVDCSTLVPTLIESELFGHARGAFTGADRAARGLFEGAKEGTLFLDEIGELPVEQQAKLLRVLQEKEIRPVGSTERIPINVRVIAATNRDLEAAVRTGRFRQDLYYRLNVVQVKLPALRERKSDLPLLVNHFFEKFSDPKEPARAISDEALQRLMAYDWPGNVRELENAIESAVALSEYHVLTPDDLSMIPGGTSAQTLPNAEELVPLGETERRAILHALRETRGDKCAAARLLGIGKTTLYRKLKQYARGPAIQAESTS